MERGFKCNDYPADKSRYNYDPTVYVATEKVAKDKKISVWSDAGMELPCLYRKRMR